MALTQADKREIETLIKKEIKDFLGKYPNLRKNKANLDFIQKEYFIIEK